MLEASFPSFLLAPSGVTWTPIRELVERLQSIKAETFLITDRSNKEAAKLPGMEKRVVTIPAAISARSVVPEDLYTPIPYIIPGQLFAASLADVKGLDPDQPRTLSKVTRTM
jgi:glucosamine--fructose-6-phosphate aminotransferase (isomerizing)